MKRCVTLLSFCKRLVARESPERMIALGLLAFLLHSPIATPGISGVQQLGTNIEGQPIKRLAPAGTRAVVLFFAATDCPIANRYVPEIEQLSKAQENAGVAVWFVYPNSDDTPDAVRVHRARYSITTNAILDTSQALVRMAHATVTPEAAIFIPTGSGLREVYRGRIDDRYAGLGQERPRAMHHDLQRALRAVLAGQPVAQPAGSPVGCAIMPPKTPAAH